MVYKYTCERTKTELYVYRSQMGSIYIVTGYAMYAILGSDNSVIALWRDLGVSVGVIR